MADLGALTDAVLAHARELGFELAGVCPASPPRMLEPYAQWIARGHHGTMRYLESSIGLRADPATLLPGVRSIVAVGINYHQDPTPVPGQPRIAQYALGRDYHKVVRGKLRRLATELDRLAPGHRHRVCVDSAPLLERELAQRAGLGWIGKNTMLINTHRGSWFLLGFLLTTSELRPSEPALGGCGTCTACIEACPTGAIVHEGGHWQVDSRKCVSYLTIEHRGAFDAEQERRVGEWTFGCDVCQEVCPFNQPRDSQPLRAQPTQEPDFLAVRQWPKLSEIVAIHDGEWDTLTQGSPVRRAGLAGLRRNAAANLTNTGD